MKIFWSLLVFVYFSKVQRGEACDTSKANTCYDAFTETMGKDFEIDHICKVKDSAMNDFEKCINDSTCSLATYVEPQRELYEYYDEYCQPGCENYTVRSDRFFNCSLRGAEIATKPDKLCQVMQETSDCMYEQIHGCPSLEQRFKNMTMMTLVPYAEMCELTYGGEQIKGETNGQFQCMSVSYEMAKCQPQQFESMNGITQIDYTNKEKICKLLELSDMDTAKSCLQNIEEENPDCFYSIDSLTEDQIIEATTSGKIPVVSVFIDVYNSFCSPECDHFVEALNDVSKCLPKPSEEVMVALNVTSQMTSGQAESECLEIENWLKVGTACAQGLVRSCKALEVEFNNEGTDGLVQASQDSFISDMYIKSQRICQIKLKVKVDQGENTSAASGMLTSPLIVCMAVLVLLQLI